MRAISVNARVWYHSCIMNYIRQPPRPVRSGQKWHDTPWLACDSLFMLLSSKFGDWYREGPSRACCTTTKNHIDSGPLLFQMSILIKNWWYHTIHETHTFNLLGFPIIAPLHTWCTWAADGLSNPPQLGSPTHSANHCDPLGIKDTILLPSWGNHSTMRWDPCRIIAMQAPGFLQGMTLSVNSFHAAHINRDLKNHRAVSHGFPDIS